MRKIYLFSIFIVFALLMSCSTTINHSRQPVISSQAKWAVLPFDNNTEKPQAGERVAAITASLLRAGGITNLSVYQPKTSCSQLLTCSGRGLSMKGARIWAKRRGVRYAMTGAINEWHYKVGLDGEPAVNVTLNLFDMRTGKAVWSAVGSKIGCSRASLGIVGQKLVREMLSRLEITFPL